jgi:hypothetical protein
MDRLLVSRALGRGGSERLFRERLSEPAHLNFLSLFVAAFGDFSSKVYFDVAFRQYTAYCLLDAARQAASLGYKRISALEFGVASGAGLLNICQNASQATKATGVEFEVYGFDTGAGLPPPRSYRDHPELYQSGDFPMDFEGLRQKLPSFARLIIGDIAETVPKFVQSDDIAPIGYVAIDVDYYWSAVEALKIFTGPPERYLPIVNMYLDDCHSPYHNPDCGELLACNEFNAAQPLRKIHPYTALREKRLFKNASWISKIHCLHVLDHRVRSEGLERAQAKTIENPYLRAAATAAS